MCGFEGWERFLPEVGVVELGERFCEVHSRICTLIILMVVGILVRRYGWF